MAILRALALGCAGSLLFAIASPLQAQNPTLVFSSGPGPYFAGQRVELWLNVLNTSSASISWHFPQSEECRVKTASETLSRNLQLDVSTAPAGSSIHPGEFARARYWLELPLDAIGQLVLEFPGLNLGSITVQAQKPPPQSLARESKGVGNALKSAEPAPPGKPFDPAHYFKEHVWPHEPFYFIAGPDSPNAKFQFSFRYQLVTQEESLGEKQPWMQGFNFAYTQTSLWDWNQASAPFLDSSYKPEFFYLWKNVYSDVDSSFVLDLQPGFQHESNGKGGEDSRSLNFTYLRSTMVFGKPDRLQFKLQPRAWFYVADLSDNPDIARYRGYVDLRGILGWERGVQLSAIGRMGDHADKGSVQLDLTYPLLRVWSGFSFYFDLQFFTGYGESLLLYNERSWAVRAGFSLYR